jgi:hypothetical protein
MKGLTISSNNVDLGWTGTNAQITGLAKNFLLNERRLEKTPLATVA